MTLEQLLQKKIDELEPCELLDDGDLEELDESGFLPIEGVSLDRWAAITAGCVIGARLEVLLDDAHLDHPQWRRACEGWTARLSRDATLVIAAALESALRRVTRRLARGSIPPLRGSTAQ